MAASTGTTSKRAATKKATAIPAGAKVPQDHKAPAQEDDGVMRVEIRGKQWEVPAEALDDFELLDDINSLEQKGEASRMPSVLRRLLGEQWSQAMEVLRDKETGRVSVTEGSKFVWELIEALNPNSPSS